MGKLVIASNHGGMSETIKDGETGFHVPPGDVDALASQILHALYMPKETRNAIGSHAMYHVQKNFSIRAMQNKTLDVYESLL
jgi:glycosyltransferase involved in cell wall biosynthesis